MVAIFVATTHQRALCFAPLVDHGVAVGILNGSFTLFISALVPVFKVRAVIPVISSIQLGNGRFGNNQLRILVSLIGGLNHRQLTAGINLQVIDAKRAGIGSRQEGNEVAGNRLQLKGTAIAGIIVEHFAVAGLKVQNYREFCPLIRRQLAQRIGAYCQVVILDFNENILNILAIAVSDVG